MTILFGVLLLLFLATSIYSLRESFSVSSLVAYLAGLAGVLHAFLDSLAKSSLRVYFWLQRLRIWWSSDLVTRWWFGARFEGHFPATIIDDLQQFLRDSEKFRFSVKVDYSNEREVQIEVEKTLTLKVTFDPAVLSATGNGTLTIVSKTMEVSYGHARRKIETQIVPVILALKDFLKPEASSYDLDVDFPERNPFFAVYIAHLQPEQIGDFRVVLHLEAFSHTRRAEKVEISRQNLHVTALSTDSFKQLALDFILLSVDTKMLAGAKVGA
jgi:hypothetical protein